MTARASESNRERILTAARRAFAERGFRGATLRGIAAEAKVDVALIAHYFTNKDGLYAETLELPPEAFRIMVDGLSGPPETQGERLTRGYLALWEDQGSASTMRVIAQGAVGSDAVRERLHAMIVGLRNTQEFATLAAGREDGVALALSHLVGVGMARHVLQIPFVCQVEHEDLIARTARAVQLHLEG